MSRKTQTTRPGAFLISEEPGAISRDAAWLAEGENLQAGTLLAVGEDDDLVEWESGDCAGILFAGTDARLSRQRVTIVKRLATVNLELLAFGAAEEADVRDALLALRIIVLADHALPLSGGGGGSGVLPEAPEGFAYIVNADGAFIINADDAYILASVGLPDAPDSFAYLFNADGAFIRNTAGAYILAKV